MQREKINLEEILRNKIGYLGSEPNLSKLVKERATSYDIISAMKEACRQTLELCAKNVKTEPVYTKACDDHTPYWGACCSCGQYNNPDIKIGDKINKQSILDTINQII